MESNLNKCNIQATWHESWCLWLTRQQPFINKLQNNHISSPKIINKLLCQEKIRCTNNNACWYFIQTTMLASEHIWHLNNFGQDYPISTCWHVIVTCNYWFYSNYIHNSSIYRLLDIPWHIILTNKKHIPPWWQLVYCHSFHTINVVHFTKILSTKISECLELRHIFHYGEKW